MNFKKYLPLIVSCSIALIILIAELVLIFRLSGSYSDVKSKVKSAERDIKTLMQREPFPSEENVEFEREKLELAQERLETVRTWMASNQVEAAEYEDPTKFNTALGENLKALHALARQNSVALPADFHFSFQKYAQGEMPAAANVPRLSRQLKMIKTVSEMLFAQRIDLLSNVVRAEFDTAQSGTALEVPAQSFGRRGARPTDMPSGRPRGDDGSKDKIDTERMYAWEELEFVFRAREQVIWNIIENLANTRLLLTVTDLKFSSSSDSIESIRKPDLRGRGPATPALQPGFDLDRSRLGGAPQAAADARPEVEIPAREERIIAGDQPVEVTMKLNIYRFLDEEDLEESEK
jgi:hypothetical protein